jgi:hypothetical protein
MRSAARSASAAYPVTTPMTTNVRIRDGRLPDTEVGVRFGARPR